MVCTWMNHGSDETEVDNIDEITGFLEAVKAFHFQELSDNLIGALIPPAIHMR